MNEVVKLISGDEKLTLDACDGKRTIVQATDVFSYIDPDFKNWGTDVAGEAISEMSVAVYELANNANFAKMFASLNSDANQLVLTQHQILNFIQKHGKWLLLGDGATFFLFRKNNGLFVAAVDDYFGVSSHRRIHVHRFGFLHVWLSDDYNQHRLVVPQL